MDIPQAIELYNRGYSLGEIAKILSVSKPSVYRYLKNKVEFRHMTSSVNDHFLDKIDTEEKAYFLGFAYADGGVRKNRCSIVFNLHQQDIALLEKFSSLLQNKNGVNLQFRHRYGKIYEHCQLELHSKYLKQQLIKWGCPPAKSLILVWPQWLIDPELQRHFIRGYFDGDGCFSTSSGYPRVQITSTNMFLSGIQNILKIENIKSQIYKAGKIYNLVISNKNGCVDFLNWIYRDFTISLERKYIKYLNFVKNNA